MNTQIRQTPSVGFTLIEILIVVVILGILAVVVIAQFVDAAREAEQTAFISSGRTFAEAATRFQLDTGGYPEDSASGALPAGFGDYVTYNQWVGGTPIGGVWDSENNSFGITSALGVHFDGTGETRNASYMQEIDEGVDDGDLTTGFFRRIAADRYYFIVAD